MNEPIHSFEDLIKNRDETIRKAKIAQEKLKEMIEGMSRIVNNAQNKEK